MGGRGEKYKGGRDAWPHLPLIKELLQFPISRVEAPVRGSWPPVVQDIGGWQVVP